MAEEVDVVDIEGDESEFSVRDQDGPAPGFLPDQYLQSAWKSNSEIVPWTLDSSISEENRAVIENMLLEEQYYLTGKELPKSIWPGEKQRPDKVKKSPVKAAHQPARWGQEEKDLFEKGLAQFGRRWTKIAKLIGSRTVLQVKSYARQYFKNKAKTEGILVDPPGAPFQGPSNGEVLGGGGGTSRPVWSVESPASSLSNAVRIQRLSDDEDVDITDDTDEDAAPRGAEEGPGNEDPDGPREAETSPGSSPSCRDPKPTPACSLDQHASLPTLGASAGLGPVSELLGGCGPLQCEAGANQEAGDKANPPELWPGGPEESGPGAGPGETLPESEDPEEAAPGLEEEEEEEEEEDEEEELKAPEQEVQLDVDAITEDEKQAIPEFFEGRPSKTPERYLKIRNYILDQWVRSKPRYLNKTSVRPGLKNCGDVNCIGRIHTYLELIGAINFNCGNAGPREPPITAVFTCPTKHKPLVSLCVVSEQAIYHRPRIVDKSRLKEGRDAVEAYQLAQRLQSMRTRKRRVRDTWGNWCDAKDLEGQTFEHLSAEELARRREEHRRRVPRPSKVPRQGKDSLDPFQLIPCKSFGEDKQEPFRVVVSAAAMVVMDMHAHVSMAEVIGLLGGGYAEGDKVLKICAAEPCNSLSTGLQCEMDPVSQTQASEALAGRGYSVVGWYHSHPAFDPNPSVRDIDTQAKFQSYFSRGGAQFIGIIVSPYNPSNAAPQSQVTCLAVSEESSAGGPRRLPFKFEMHPSPEEPDWPQVLRKARWVIDKYRLSHGSVPMDRLFHRDSDLTCLEKMLASMRSSLDFLQEDAVTGFLAQVETLFLSWFVAESRSGYTEGGDAASPGECPSGSEEM
ncbi:histone H2A deubiquitinase MYSM1 isoform X1 [Amia ocellicauda]|uniref:histone H2A deubiquitinase MYSM1 isoform X1 n=1 Tax=Amia ocellicauda TaxID=2972642 RepID=UPI003463CFDE